MGLTIHYSLHTCGSDAHARKLIHTLHQTARDLPFQELGKVVELSGDQCASHQRKQNDPLGWLLIQAEESVELVARRRVYGEQIGRTWCRVQPIRVLAFHTWPGKGCEAANFGLCQYPAVVATTDGPLKTGLSDWRWRAYCKTQYASDPQCGGIPHFLQCHLTVMAMLDKARELGCLKEIKDEGGFWAKRDLSALVQQVGSWNEMIAALAGKLKDALGHGALGIQSAISHYPNFEQLEASGQGKLPPGCEQLARLIQRVGQGPRGCRGDRVSTNGPLAGKQNPFTGSSV